MRSMNTVIDHRKIVNKPRKVLRNSIILALLMIAAAVISGYSLDGMRGGYALIVIFGFIALTFIIVAFIYYPRAREFDRLVNDMSPLAHWTFSEEEWKLFTEEDLRESVDANKASLKMLIIISAIICGILAIVYKDSFFIYILAGIIIFYGVIAMTVPHIRKKSLLKGNRDVIIGKDSIIVGNSFQTWKFLGAKLRGVVVSNESNIPLLLIRVDFPTRHGYQESVIRSPIPFGKLKDAEQIASELEKKIMTD